ncbi:MAG: cupin domain-containing protein [Flavobacterium sp.]|uniref:cupin domain-containing protein n=1 Tax=Flavobacterium sp. TaxID=239 RepID=UPI0011F5ABB8|nr:cupin domain-containing protein [Flavobacterium sp.]RZJ67591.1 MAG: cupin domain-containing protein [Flavobacterium sp.]
MTSQDEAAAGVAAIKIVRAGHGNQLNVLGDSQTIKISGKETNGKFTVIENFNEPGIGIPMHVHENEDEIFHIIEGEMEFTLENETRILKKGDMIFLPRKVPHAFKCIGNHKTKAVVTVVPSGIEDMFKSLSELPVGPPDFENVMRICGEFGIRFV